MRKSFLWATAAALVASGASDLPLPPGSHVLRAAEPAHKHGEGHKHKLGRRLIGQYTVSVILIGEVEAGRHVDFDIKLMDVKTDPKALRVWVGTEDGKGSEKAEGKKGKTTYTGEVNVPKPLPDGARLWVELETEGGINRGSFSIEEDDHQH